MGTFGEGGVYFVRGRRYRRSQEETGFSKDAANSSYGLDCCNRQNRIFGVRGDDAGAVIADSRGVGYAALSRRLAIRGGTSVSHCHHIGGVIYVVMDVTFSPALVAEFSGKRVVKFRHQRFQRK